MGAKAADGTNIRSHPPEVWEVLLDRVAAGEGVVEACAARGSPRFNALSKRRRKDLAFDARFTAAIAAGAEARERPWRALLARLGAGEAPPRLWGAPGLPTRGQCAWRLKTDPGFAADYRAALKPWLRANGRHVNELPSGQPSTIPRDVFERFEELARSAPSLEAVAALPGMPSRTAVYKRRKAWPEYGQRFATIIRPTGIKYSPAAYERALREIQNGARLNHFTGGELPTKDALLRFRKRNPDFDARVRAALAIYRPMAADDHADGLARGLSQNEVYAAVNAALPRFLDRAARDDVIGDMVVAVLSGELRLADVKGAARHFIADHNRRAGTWRNRCLDAPLTAGGTFTLMDTLSA